MTTDRQHTFSGTGFTITHAVVGPIDNNAYLITDDRTGRGLVVDAADDVDALVEMIGDTDVEAIVTTHGHWDHHQAAGELGALLGLTPMLHSEDTFMVDKDFAPLGVGSLHIGGTPAQVIHTPGHTPGSVCLLLDGVVLTGDTLFPGGPGATRFDHSSFETIIESIRTKLFTLADDIVILPGHGAATTIGAERGNLQDWIDRGW